MAYEKFIEWTGIRYDPEDVITDKDIDNLIEKMMKKGRDAATGKQSYKKQFFQEGTNLHRALQEIYIGEKETNVQKILGRIKTSDNLNELNRFQTEYSHSDKIMTEINERINQIETTRKRERTIKIRETITRTRELAPREKIETLKVLKPATQQEKLIVGRNIALAKQTLVRQYYDENPDTTLLVSEVEEELEM